MLSQLVDVLALPCVVFEVPGEVLALNGPPRAAFRIKTASAASRTIERLRPHRLPAGPRAGGARRPHSLFVNSAVADAATRLARA